MFNSLIRFIRKQNGLKLQFLSGIRIFDKICLHFFCFFFTMGNFLVTSFMVLSWNKDKLLLKLSSRAFKWTSTTVWPEPIWTKVSGWWQIPPLHKIFKEIVFYEVNLVSQCLHLEVLLLCKSGSVRGDLNWCRFWVFTLMLR